MFSELGSLIDCTVDLWRVKEHYLLISRSDVYWKFIKILGLWIERIFSFGYILTPNLPKNENESFHLL